MTATSFAGEPAPKFDDPVSETSQEEEPGDELSHLDYVELVKTAYPTTRENWEFYRIFIDYRDAYAAKIPSIFDNPSWPLFIALRAEEHLKIQRVRDRARNASSRRRWTPSPSVFETASLGQPNKDVRSPTHPDHVKSTYQVVPERSHALGNAYRWVDGKWIFSGKGYRRENGKWVAVESELGVQGADGLHSSR